MKKIWSYIAVLFIGISAGIVAGAKMIPRTIYKGSVRIRQKGRNSAHEAEISPILEVSDKKRSKPLERKKARRWARNKLKT